MPKPLSTKDAVALMADLLVPAATVFRTVKVQPHLDRFENDAEHSFSLAILGCAIAEHIDPKLDLGKISQYALVHDLVEVFAGDTSIWDSAGKHASKAEREDEALHTIEKRFPQFPWLQSTIKQYEKFTDPESCFVYALDKIVPYVLMLAVDHQPYPHTREVYEEKMALARKKVSRYPALSQFFGQIYLSYSEKAHFFSER